MTPILATKLYIPQPRPNAVSRPRLIERLNKGQHRKLTLISAPAGFGKTTLVSEWLAEGTRPVAWLSLEQGENDPVRFLTYLIAALQTLAAALGEGVLNALQSSQPPPTEVMLTSLLNEIAIIQGQFVLVLDDYHIIDARPVDSALTYLIEHLPPQMHLVITTREDPRLPLARLRAGGQLTELRSADLRFTTAEVAAFLSQGTGFSLSATEIAQLAERTEGWIVGLQLAALSMQGHQDVSEFIRAFTGDHRYIVDYLVEEVLRHQPESVRHFLLQTAILERLNGPLCDAVTGLEKGNEQLEALERGNFFVVPLDDKRQWYRYHHLFAEVLSAHLIAEQPDQVATLHQRASKWYEQNGSAADAIHHALVAEDFERAAALMELELPAMQRNRQEATFLDWLKALPDKQIHFRPVLCVGYAWALLASGELEAAHARLQDAERWLDTTADASERPPSTEMVIVDKEGFRRLPVFIAVYRAAHAQASGDIPNTIKYARRVLDLLPEEDHLGRGAATALLGLAFWTDGDLEAAHQTFANGIASVQMAGNLSDAISGTLALADIRVAQGRLHEAMHTYERALQELGESGLRGTADLYVGMSELHSEQNDLHTAMQLLLKSKELGERTRLPPNQYRWCVAMARIKEAQGDLEGALDLFHKAEHLYRRDFFPNVRPVAALVARVWITQGRLGKALSWAREQGLEVSDNLSYLREFEHITLVRLLLARYKSDRANHSILEAIGLLERLLKAAQYGKRVGSIIEILVLQALAYQMQGNISTALMALQQALQQAKPEGYIRMFVDEGAPIIALLEEAAKRGFATNYVRQLLRASGATENSTLIKQDLIEPLSEREFEVLRLLRTDLNGPEIADKLIVSLNTIRTHTKNIYNKLGVNNRRAAIRRAEELNLF
ncbi:LuxR family transcriptional regulator [Reticulibacter mediterranei]|uniref:LuxR family transcriptional regulator n=1 Tax=Reticulibacter mediterranei TaxID=2778369 RepID=A0A8J3IDW7_9CHLR|nr:LuxR C-terminal-related transcriptional regulator [Reticulibacter mediterranei]GHO90665.1 LuxR family transcriptional regulator [Reticulibacter mediterranei]